MKSEKIIQISKLYQIIHLESFVLIFLFCALTWFFYKIFLKDVSDERHQNIRNHQTNLAHHFLILTFLFLLFSASLALEEFWSSVSRVTPYFALLAFFWGNLVLIKTARLSVLQYMFLTSMRAGVPLLLVNIFTLILSVLLGFWGLSRVFDIQLMPLVATSAAFSIILGLAMQDTLGNLFAGISLQVDKSFEIGDWLEVVNGLQKSVGQVKELSWRSTLLVGLSDELITIPNRIMAQALISNYSPDQPIMRSQIFRLPYGSDINQARDILERSVIEISDIKAIPKPFSYVNDATESWISVKLLYFIDSYGAQFIIGDKVLRKGIETLLANGYSPATTLVQLK